VFLVNFAKYLHRDDVRAPSNSTDEPMSMSSTSVEDLFTLKYYKLEGLGYFLFPAMAVSYITYFGFGGLLHVRLNIIIYNYLVVFITLMASQTSLKSNYQQRSNSFYLLEF